MITDLPSPISVLGLTFVFGLLPFVVIMGTAFTKISIVLMLLRNALGVQQAPSALVINSIALTLTAFITFPLAVSIVEGLDASSSGFANVEEMKRSYGIVSKIISADLQKHAFDREVDFFKAAAFKLWPQSLHGYVTDDNLLILLPSHIVSEITRAFEISFLLFLPFVVVDLIVSNILLAMGAMMLPPMLISLPAKLLLFVAADGWTRLLHGLILSYV